MNNKDQGLIIVDKNKYGNIELVTHSFKGTATIDEAIRNIVLTKLKEKKLINQ